MSNNIKIPLSSLPIGRHGKVMTITSEGPTRRRMLDLGFVRGTDVLALRKSPLGDPTAYKIRGAVIALRQEEASYIYISAN